jgi:uncharacterized protein YbjT (DUF2867 family)
MKKILLFGASGNLGKAIAQEAHQRGYELSAVVRSQHKAKELQAFVNHTILADVTNPSSLKGLFDGQDAVISALGKSVSPNDRSKPSFRDIDLVANSHLLEEAKRSGIKKFVYVSAMHSELYPQLEYFRVHHEFSEKLKASGLNYSIVKPPAIFSAFLDMFRMAEKGRLVTIGDGSKKTNPIFEGDLAKVCVDAVHKDNATIEAGGKTVYTRHQINEIIQETIAPHKKIRKVPFAVMSMSLPMMKLFDRNSYDKFAFFVEVMKTDLLAPQVGEMRLEDYIRMKV